MGLENIYIGELETLERGIGRFNREFSAKTDGIDSAVGIRQGGLV